MMKSISLSVFIFALSLSVGAVAATDLKTPPTTVKHVFGIHGLTCPFCATGIEKTFMKVDGVQSVKVSLKNSTVTVNTKQGVCFSKEELNRLIEQSGFTYHGTIEQPDSCKNPS